MNDLSWIIYLADVLPNLTDVAYFGAFFALAFGGAGMVFWTIAWRDGAPEKPWFGTYAALLVFLAAIIIATPSRETILMIAGSELGEVVVTSDEGAQALDDIKTIIGNELARMAGREVSE